jgi:hypothetical protein
MGDAISRDEMKARLYKLRSRTDQWKPSSFRAGYREAVDFALSDAESCRPVEAVLITRCGQCRSATERNSTMPYCMIHNRRKNPDDFCNFGAPDE